MSMQTFLDSYEDFKVLHTFKFFVPKNTLLSSFEEHACFTITNSENDNKLGELASLNRIS